MNETKIGYFQFRTFPLNFSDKSKNYSTVFFPINTNFKLTTQFKCINVEKFQLIISKNELINPKMFTH